MMVCYLLKITHSIGYYVYSANSDFGHCCLLPTIYFGHDSVLSEGNFGHDGQCFNTEDNMINRHDRLCSGTVGLPL